MPENWRAIFSAIVDWLVQGDFGRNFRTPPGVEPVSPSEAKRFEDNVAAYGDKLVPLDPAVWESSIYTRSTGHWRVLVDLSTAKEAVSDLVLHARIADEIEPKVFLDSVHVP